MFLIFKQGPWDGVFNLIINKTVWFQKGLNRLFFINKFIIIEFFLTLLEM